MRVLFVITARGGSKGVPRKNIRMVGKFPLIAYKIIAAKKCRYESRVIVSTDDEEIAKISKDYGAEVPFMRPKELADDSASSMDVVMHAMNWISENDTESYDYICLLEPSSPFASYKDLNNALELLEKTGADTLLGMKEVEVSTRFIHTLDENGGLSEFYRAIKDQTSVRRQDQKKEYTMNGCMYIAKWDYFMKNKLFHSEKSIPYIMPEEKSIEIDTMLNYEMACNLVEKGMIDVSLWSD
ncbi:MAG: acylneuraminate cytidylyltransferase family protein [Lachnospiraceae bacterium]|nr:acylneuraminate cytidylyltransferase family protein [Lachnospiraceae bacterium]